MLAPSQSVKHDLVRHERVPADRVRVLYGCAESSAADADGRAALRRELGCAQTDPIIGCVGRLVPEKQYPVLVQAFAQLARRRPAARLAIVGDGPERGRIAREIAAHQLADRVHLLGRRRDAGTLVGGFDVFALASRIEGLPIAVVEAMMAGVPVVATDVAGLPELIRHGHTGWLVPVHDAGALAAAMLRYLDDPDLARTMAGRAQADARARFLPSRYAEELVELYRDLLKTNDPTHG